MTTIRKNGAVFSVTLEQTKEYYASPALCNCAYCRNYYPQIRAAFPVLDSFLSEFGADISSPDEIMGVEITGHIDYFNVDYTVCGTIESLDAKEIELSDGLPLRIVFTNGFVSPNHQTGDYFTISVMGIKLPWVLDEPFPGAEKKPEHPKCVLKRFFKRYKR